jgi:tellurite resistance protein TerB
METSTIVRLWAAAAWADGVLHPAEAAALRRLIDASDDLGGERRAEALALLDGPPDVKLDEVQALGPVAREGVYRAALGIVRLDGKVTADEEEWVAKLRNRLHFDETILKKIEAEH